MILRQRRLTSTALWLLGLSLLFVGCSAGNGKSGSGGTNGTGGTNGSSALTEQARTAALDAIAAKYDALPQTSATDDANALLAFLRSRSEFSVSGIAKDNSVWARFNDGRPLVIALNDFPLKPGSKQASRALNQRQGRSTSGEPLELPASSKVYLVNTRETGDAAVTQTFDQLENNFLPPNSYQPVVIEGTIENLKVIKNAGVLYNIGHAGLGYKGLPREDPGTPEYIFGTLTRRDVGTDSKYNTELTDGEVGYLLEPTLIDRFTGAPLSRYKLSSGYFITDVFVAKNWTFSANSVFISDNCDGACDEAQPFIKACFSAGLSVYMGWDNAVVNADANESALFLFDRMLGYNDLSAARQPEQPQQRPFDYISVLTQMATLKRTGSGAAAGTNLVTSTTIDSLAYGFLKGGPAHLLDFQNPADGQGNGGILNPTISAARIDEVHRQLVLDGIFGSDPKTDSHAVLVGGTDLTAQTTWTPTRLTIDNLPVSGAGASGDVSVNVRGHLSNLVQITEWKGKFTSTEHQNGAEMLVLTFNAHLRGILNSLRTAPGQTPALPPPNGHVSITGAPDTTCNYDAFGQDETATDLQTLSRGGDANIPFYSGEPADPNRFSSFGITLDLTSASPKMQVITYGYTSEDGTGITVTDVYKPTNKTNVFTFPLLFDVAGDFTGSLDANYNIVAGSWTSDNGAKKIEWGDIAAVSPPKTADTSAARAAALRPSSHRRN